MARLGATRRSACLPVGIVSRAVGATLAGVSCKRSGGARRRARITERVPGLTRESECSTGESRDPELPVLSGFLAQIGVPFDTLIATNSPLSDRTLSDGAGRGYYQGVILTNGNLPVVDAVTGATKSAFTESQWRTLWQYEA